jgi:hypothetical protein
MSPALADSLPVTRQAVGKQFVVLDRAGPRGGAREKHEDVSG